MNDSQALEHLYERIGYWAGQERTYETRRAILAQMQVLEELLAGLDAAGAPAARGRSGASASDQRRLYDAYCAVCHGRNGRGRGPAREVLATDPADLTLLAQRNGGAFPRSAVERCILASARRASAAAASEMPVWTAPPSSDHVPGPAAHAGSIAAYVESIQRR